MVATTGPWRGGTLCRSASRKQIRVTLPPSQSAPLHTPRPADVTAGTAARARPTRAAWPWPSRGRAAHGRPAGQVRPARALDSREHTCHGQCAPHGQQPDAAARPGPSVVRGRCAGWSCSCPPPRPMKEGPPRPVGASATPRLSGRGAGEPRRPCDAHAVGENSDRAGRGLMPAQHAAGWGRLLCLWGSSSTSVRGGARVARLAERTRTRLRI